VSEEEQGYGLVMPFVTVATKGGPHDDQSYVAGWEMGALDARLEYERPPVLEMAIQLANVPQADLLAMKHGYGYEITEHDDQWSWLKLTRTQS
jgi:hypothetical protein